MTQQFGPDEGLRFPIEKRLMLGMLNDALEGGMADWAQVDRYDWPRWYEDEKNETIKEEVTGDYVLLKVRDAYQDKAFVDITVDRWEAAIQWAVIHHNRWLNFTVENGITTDIDYDAVGADIVLQRAVIGEVIYG